VHLEPGCVDDIIHKTLEAFRPSFEARGMATEVQLNAPSWVHVDADALEQIMNNLLSNAEKYAASGKELKISSRQNGTTTRIVVKDRGPGISSKEAARVFAPFYRVSSKLTDGATGTGIGLGIARQLAQLHCGDLLLKDGGPGACFEIRIQTPQAGLKN
jgi:signal transduction histidine kinase